jgi:hypothetical protein
MMEAAWTSETPINFYQTTLRYNPEHSHLRTHRRENLKTYLGVTFLALSSTQVCLILLRDVDTVMQVLPVFQ